MVQYAGRYVKRYKKNQRKDCMRKVKTIITIVIVLLVLVALGVAARQIMKIVAPSTERISPQEYYRIPEGEVLTIQDDTLAQKNVCVRDGYVYLPFALVNQLNDRFYWDEEMQFLIFTTGTEKYIVSPNETFYYLNDVRTDADSVILIERAGEFYILLDYVEHHIDLQYRMYLDPNRIILNYHWGEYLCADVTAETQMRTEPDKKSPILLDLTEGMQLQYFNSGGIQQNGYVMVMTEDGIYGYVRMKDIGESYYKSIQSTYEEPAYSTESRANSINLTWHMTVTEQANEQLDALFAGTEGLNVISPTWFNVMDETGALESRASQAYVERAHELGLEVWGLVANSHPNAADVVEIDELALLKNYNSRTNLIQEIVRYATEYGLDGVNIDFESLEVETGPYYIQFLRELAVVCRNQKLVLSVDNYVPAEYNAFYDLEEQGKIVDYVIIMAYDEHYVGSDAGSVASIGFVTDAATNTLAKVPAERVIMAVPFYTRLWKETRQKDGSLALTSETIGIAAADALLRENKVSTTWQADAGQFYGEYEQGGSRYRIWLEDEMSIEEKMKVIQNSGFAGVASWRLGLERRSVWEVMLKYLH